MMQYSSVVYEAKLLSVINKKHSVKFTYKDFTKPHDGDQIFGPQTSTCESIGI